MRRKSLIKIHNAKWVEKLEIRYVLYESSHLHVKIMDQKPVGYVIDLLAVLISNKFSS